jgi:oxygen-independent coproporphyrinogen III oxidase
MARILVKIKDEYKLAKQIETTLECNPDDISNQVLKEWFDLGINRLSIGIQSFDDRDLEWMNRAHRSEEALNCVKMAQKVGFNNISIDLIYGLPNMDLYKWEKHIEQALNLNIQHISAYCLTIEEKTALHHLVKTNKISPASNELQSQHFELLQKTLKEAGFIQYEISNFGREDYFSKHNSSYWKGIPYLGIGPSAHSFDGKNRAWNVSNNTIYIKEIKKGILPIERETLSEKDQFNELLLTGLRTIWGVSISKLESLRQLDVTFKRKLVLYQEKAYLEMIENHIILTEKGMHFADGIASDLFI